MAEQRLHSTARYATKVNPVVPILGRNLGRFLLVASFFDTKKHFRLRLRSRHWKNRSQFSKRWKVYFQGLENRPRLTSGWQDAGFVGFGDGGGGVGDIEFFVDVMDVFGDGINADFHF